MDTFRRLLKATFTRPIHSIPSQDAAAATAPSIDDSEFATRSVGEQDGKHTTKVKHGQSTASLSLASQFTGDPNLGLKVLVDQPADRKDSVDIIALHGLNGDRDHTWTDRETGLNWLSHENCLPKDVPHARILTFGYNSKTYFSRAKSDIQDFASELLAAIDTQRLSDTERRRPLLFLCHSLGGLVFKQMVISAHEQDTFYSGILNSIQGVVFFGTPHRGSDLASWDLMAVSLLQASTLGYIANSKLSKDLKIKSRTLKRISESFAHRGAKFGIRSFYETQSMPGLNCLVVEKASACLNWPNELAIASSAHHSNICKFSSPLSQRYQAAISAIQQLMAGCEGQQDANAPFTLQEESCMRMLNSIYEDCLHQVDDPVVGTCKWILEHEQFQWWESAESPALLWVSANPGCGKSVMAKFLIAHLQSQIDEDTTTFNLCYFFFKEGLEQQHNASCAVSAITHQLYTAQHSLVKHALPRFSSTNQRVFTGFSSLWTILIESLRDSIARKTVCVIDGLDECEAQSFVQLVHAISQLFAGASDSNLRLKLLLLSRPNNRMETTLCLPSVEVADKDSSNSGAANRRRLIAENESRHLISDIAKFARHKVRQLSETSSLPIDVLSRLDNQLLAGADFTFLWISLVMQLIEDAQLQGICVAELELILKTNKLDDLYEHLLRARVLPLKTRKILYIVLAAVRPLTLKEMCVAIEVQQDHHPGVDTRAIEALSQLGDSELNSIQPPSSDDPTLVSSEVQENAVSELDDLKRLLRTPFSNHLRQMCGHLVCIRNRKIYLIHQTARDFLLRREKRQIPELHMEPTSGNFAVPLKSRKANSKTRPSQTYPSRYRGLMWTRSGQQWQHSVRLKDANRYLLHVCGNYLALFGAQPNADRHWSRHEVSRYLEECKRDPPRAFFRYAATHWTQHYGPVRQQSIPVLTFDYLLHPNDHFLKSWIFMHPSCKIGEEMLEPGAAWVGKMSHADGGKEDEHSATLSFYHRPKSDKGLGRDFSRILDFFFPLDPGMEEYDDEFVAGDHYWKTVEGGLESEEVDSGEDEYGAEEGERIPDRVQWYRRRRQKELLDSYADMSSPFSPGGGNPLNPFSPGATFVA